MRKKLGELLVHYKVIDERQLKQALNEQSAWGGKLGENLIRLGFIDEEKLVRFLAAKLEISIVDLGSIDIDYSILKLIPDDYALRNSVIPFMVKKDKSRNVLYIAMSDPTNVVIEDEISTKVGMPVKSFISTFSQIQAAINFYYYHDGDHPYHLKNAKPPTAEPAPGPVKAATAEQLVELAERIGDGQASDSKALAMIEMLIRLLEIKGLLTKDEISAIYRSMLKG